MQCKQQPSWELRGRQWLPQYLLQGLFSRLTDGDKVQRRKMSEHQNDNKCYGTITSTPMGQPKLQTWNLQWDPTSSNQETLSGQLGICSTASQFSVSSKGNSFNIANVIIFLQQIHKIHKKLFPETQCHKQSLLCSGSSEVSQVSTTIRARLTSSAVLVHWLGATNFSKTDSDTDFHIFVEIGCFGSTSNLYGVWHKRPPFLMGCQSE